MSGHIRPQKDSGSKVYGTCTYIWLPIEPGHGPNIVTVCFYLFPLQKLRCLRHLLSELLRHKGVKVEII